MGNPDGGMSDELTKVSGLLFRTWIQRLARKTICFSRLEKRHDIVIELLINKVEFGRDICA